MTLGSCVIVGNGLVRDVATGALAALELTGEAKTLLVVSGAVVDAGEGEGALPKASGSDAEGRVTPVQERCWGGAVEETDEPEDVDDCEAVEDEREAEVTDAQREGATMGVIGLELTGADCRP